MEYPLETVDWRLWCISQIDSSSHARTPLRG